MHARAVAMILLAGSVAACSANAPASSPSPSVPVLAEQQTRLGPLEDYVADHPATFGGIWIDPRGTLVVELAHGRTSLPEPAASLVPAGWSIRLQSVPNDLQSLDALSATISAELGNLQASGMDVVSVGVDTPHDRVAVGVDGLSDAIRAALVARYGPRIEVQPDQPLQPLVAPGG
jgi:hypothetical protein